MRTYWYKTPFWVRWLYPELITQIKTDQPVLYLTFDDGPTPEVTDYVLDLLRQYQAEATFFCLGEHVRRHAHLFDQIKDAGHAIGNHGYEHLNARKVDLDTYVANVNLGHDALVEQGVESRLYRPPYGQMTKAAIRSLHKPLHLVLWTFMAGDFDPDLHVEDSMKALKQAKPGSIFVFHDSEKAFDNLKNLLPGILEYYSNLGFTFKSLNHAFS